MDLPALLPPGRWAAMTFGPAALGDARRTRRLVALATALATQPAASLPHQLGQPAALKAAYRLFGTEAIGFADVLAPHVAQTHALAGQAPLVLLVQDTTELDFTAHRATTGLAPIGNGGGRGFHLQTVLAVQPAPRLPLGVLAAEPWLRQPAPRAESRTARARRPRESDVWVRLVVRVGAPPSGTRWVHVADRGADCFGFLDACRRTGSDVLVRVTQDRCVTGPDGLPGQLLDVLRDQPAAAARPLALPAQHGRPAGETTVAVSWTALTLLPAPRPAPLPGWAVRVWEPAPPAERAPLEWLLVTTVPVTTVAEAWERVAWYTARWLIEDFHQCLKAGCGAEQSQLRDRAALWRRLAVLLPLALRLLQLREWARATPQAPATTLAEPLALRLLAARSGLPPATTVADLQRQLARLGGHLGRPRDGPPGWRTLWRGWLTLQTLVEGARLAATLDPP